jgi:hypothetical protein
MFLTKGAEQELLSQGKVEECIEMYQKLFKHDQAIRVAEQARHPEAMEMRQAYFQYLLDTNQVYLILLRIVLNSYFFEI